MNWCPIPCNDNEMSISVTIINVIRQVIIILPYYLTCNWNVQHLLITKVVWPIIRWWLSTDSLCQNGISSVFIYVYLSIGLVLYNFVSVYLSGCLSTDTGAFSLIHWHMYTRRKVKLIHTLTANVHTKKKNRKSFEKRKKSYVHAL